VGKHRDRLRIIAAILDACASGACKTRIMLQANLNFTLLEKYLVHVMRLGLLQVEGQTYSLTEQGRDFLNDYKLFHNRYLNAQEWLKYLDSEHERLSRLCEKL